ncbi:hypothetical protein HDU81_009766 [Chytriomyces hyalinus]|nr:hypothetical protein HDU81_009766 [Chytriomyces hyalinus]
MFSVLSIPFQRHFRVPMFSQASLLACALVVASIVLPLVWAYSAQSFWIKTNTFRTQPAVMFMRDLIFILDGQDALSGVSVTHFHSSNPRLNQLMDSSVHSAPVVRTSEVDENNDGLPDHLAFTISVALPQNDEINRVRMAFFFRYDVDDVARLTMQTAAILDFSTSSSASTLAVDGDLRINQRDLLYPYLDNYRYNRPVLNHTLPIAQIKAGSLTWESMISRYSDRNIRTIFQPSTPPSWISPRAINQPFTVTGKIRYVPETFSYRPGVMEVLKAAWIQYLAYFALVATVCRYTFEWAVKSGVVPSHVIIDALPKQDGFRGHVF